MITGSELITLVRDVDLYNAMTALKKDFLKVDPAFMDLSDDDFISITLISPSIGIALANGSVSHYEEITLRRKARKLSRRSFFQKNDPLAPALRYLAYNFSEWENRFYELIKITMHSSLKANNVVLDTLKNPQALTGDLKRDILNAPFIFVKFLSFLFMEEDDDLLNERAITEVELAKIRQIGVELEIDNVPIFQEFCDSFVIRSGDVVE
ncbi:MULTISPECIES: hypothetical protein [Flammeovirga]|uniref:Uncharacterized protein n=1 Tax=Flammeovirga agarivorans TaxID=2726742 RepID=A0A7X8XUS1_9BACT|nr:MULTISPECIES: hypothetical protein [Flammeovirga]NLR90633.1 hypothetical protein [Flammeovirga agarivorans]